MVDHYFVDQINMFRKMNSQQLETLKTIMKITARPQDSPQEQLEALRSWVYVNLGLYQQERDNEGVELYQPMADILSKTESLEQLRVHLKMSPPDSTAPHRS